MAEPDLSQYDPVFQAAGTEWNVDPTLLKAVAAQESRGNPNAVSPAKAQGLMQITPETQSYLGVTNPFDPVQSIYGAAKYLNEGLTKEGSPEGALLYYHGGPGWRQAYGPESQGYVPAVTAHYLALKPPDQAQPSAPPSPTPSPSPTAAPQPPLIIGDSLASRGGLGGTGVVGASPSAVRDNINGMKPEDVNGRDVILSSGASNNPSQAGLLEDQIRALNTRGAKSITVVGVGNAPTLAGVNDALAATAGRFGATFVPLDTTQLSPDGVHPTQNGYRTLLAAATPRVATDASPAFPPAPASATGQGTAMASDDPLKLLSPAPKGDTAPTQSDDPLKLLSAAPAAPKYATTQTAPLTSVGEGAMIVDPATGMPIPSDPSRGYFAQDGSYVPPTKPAAPAAAPSATPQTVTIDPTTGAPMMTAAGPPTSLPSAAAINETVRNALAPAPNTTYGDVLPLAMDDKTGQLRLAMPNMLRAPLLGLTGGVGANALTIDPATNQVRLTPEAQAAGSLVANPLQFSGDMPLVRGAPATFGRPLPVTVDEVSAAINRANRQPAPATAAPPGATTPSPASAPPSSPTANPLNPDAAARQAAAQAAPPKAAGPAPTGAAGGAWRPVQPGEIFQPGGSYRMNTSTGQQEVFEPAPASRPAAAQAAPPQAAPPPPAARAASPEGGAFLNRDWLLNAGQTADGSYDMGKGGAALATEARDALARGDTVHLVADQGGKTVPIVGVTDNGMLVDAQRQQWGSAWVAFDGTGREGLRITPGERTQAANDTGGAQAEAPQPQAAGAPATPAGDIPAQRNVERARNLRVAINESAQDRAGANLRDDNAYVANIPPRVTAERDFSPDESLSHKYFYNTDANYRAAYDAHETARNTGMVDLLGNDAGDALTLDQARATRRQAAPDNFGAFENERPVDASSIATRIQQVLDSPEGKRDAVQRTLNNVAGKLYDSQGNLETAPSQLYGVRQHISDLMDKAQRPLDREGTDAQVSRFALRDLLDRVDAKIQQGAPNYQAYRQAYRDLSQPVNQQRFLQRYWQGTKKLTGSDGQLDLRRVDAMLEDIHKGLTDQKFNPAQSLTEQQIQNVIDVRNELAARKLLRDQAAVPGSPTVQLLSRAAEKSGGMLGTAIRGAAALGGHALAAHLNMPMASEAIGAYQVAHPFMAQMRRQRRISRAQAAEQAMKERLLSVPPVNALSQGRTANPLSQY